MTDITNASLGESSSQDEGDDSDDDFLYVQPTALLQRPSLSSKLRDPVQADTCITDDVDRVGSVYSQPVPAGTKKLKYSLDRIVQTNARIEQDKKDAGLANLQESLRHGIVEGGMTKLIEEDEEEQGEEGEIKIEPREYELLGGGTATLESGIFDSTPLLPEHEETLQQYALENERIATVHPGEDIFCNSDIGKLFTFPVDLSLSPEANAMEKLVMTSTPEELEELLMSRTILDIYLVKQCPDSVFLWLLQLMSICDNVMVVGMIFDTMWSLMNSLQHLHPAADPWCPTLQDIAAIFVNYGARLDSLLPSSLFQTKFTAEDLIVSCKKDKKSDLRRSKTKPNHLPVYNLQQVIKIITQCLVSQHRKPLLSQENLISLAYLVCTVSLDTQLVRYPVRVDFHHCLAAVLNCFEDDEWNHVARKLCKLLTHCSQHHHNLVHLVRLMRTGTHRGKIVCPMLSCVFLEKLTTKPGLDKVHRGAVNQASKVSDLIPLLAACKPRCRTDTDYYQLHSLITLVELAVSYDKGVYKPSDKEALARLVIMLRDMAGDIRESHKHLCRTQVKDLIIRIASELAYLEQTLTSKQMFFQTFVKYEPVEDSKKTFNNEARCVNAEDACHTDQDDDDDDAHGVTGKEDADR